MVSAPAIAVLTHVPYEGPAHIAEYCRLRGCRVVTVPLYRQVPPPAVGDCDALVVMGGPMSVHDARLYPWLREERRCIERHISRGIPVAGICLGAQLVATALGASVYPHERKEIGFWPVEFVRPAEGQSATLWDATLATFPARATVLHWHGDTFDLPDGAVLRARSDGCRHQMFTYGDHVAAIQFHLEATPESVLALSRAGREGIGRSFYEVDPSGRDFEARLLRAAGLHTGRSNLLMRRTLDACLGGLFSRGTETR